jgi:hypothetical protein
MWNSRGLINFLIVCYMQMLKTVLKKTESYSEIIFFKIFNRPPYTHAAMNAQKHYHLDSELFIRMVDKRMVYTCAYMQIASVCLKDDELFYCIL